MIISRRDERLAAACQGLTGDLVIFSSMFGGGVTVRLENTEGEYEREGQTEEGMGNYF